MSDAADRLAKSRLAIIAQIERREHGKSRGEARERHKPAPDVNGEPQDEIGGRAGRWFARGRHALRTWWRYHPAHMGLELATPALSAYAGRKPLQFLGIAAAVGMAVVVARPWRLISITGLLMAIAKSSRLSTVLLSALSAAGDQTDHQSSE